MYICLIWGPVFCHQTSPGCFVGGPRPIRWPFSVSKSVNCPGFLEAELQWHWRAIGVLGKKSQVSTYPSKINRFWKNITNKNDVLMRKKGSMEFKWIDAFEAPPRSLFQKLWRCESELVYSMYLFFFAEVAEQFGLPPPNHPVFSSSVESSLLKTPWLCFFLC